MDIYQRMLHTWNREVKKDSCWLEVGKQGLPKPFGTEMILSVVQDARHGARRFAISSGCLSCFGSIFLLYSQSPVWNRNTYFGHFMLEICSFPFNFQGAHS